jgi:ABC-type dipeptide/oligopeptide/nickel transport system permease subunit
MLAEARIYLSEAPWLMVAPSVCIFITVAAASLCAEALQEETRE